MPENDADPHDSPSLGTSAAYEVQPAGTSGALTGHLAPLVERARGYVDASSSANTRRAYAADWAHFSSWCRRNGLSALTPDPETVGLYITALASGEAAPRAKPSAVSTIERRLSA
ncbi:MAG: integrase, partial [Martelella sp.]